jgi:LPXTG-motif cell wall-anchored protein
VCVEPDVAVDVDNDGTTDTCIDVYTEVIPPTGELPTESEAVPPRPIPATGSDTNVPLQLGVLLMLAGLIAMVAGHRRASDEHP